MAVLISAVSLLFFICSPLLSKALNSGFSIDGTLNSGFSIDLIHRDSPRSPFYNPDETNFQRIVNAYQRSKSRGLRFSQKTDLDMVEAVIVSNHGEYLMNISIGTPAVNILAIADTGSDLIWTQCKPCQNCYKQDAPLFDPKRSKTYKDVSCSSRQCRALKFTRCIDGNSSCPYTVGYGDASFTKGNIAVDTVTLGSTEGRRPVALPKTLIGCGHNNEGTFYKKASGIVGLGGGPSSLISQLGDSIDGKFSYCLVPFSSQSKKTSMLNFGKNAVVSGRGSVSTPLIKFGSQDTFYNLNLEAISVNDNRIKYFDWFTEGTGANIIIDSGTPLTILPTDVYSKVESAVKDAVQRSPVQGPHDWKLCYEASSDLQLPKMTVHFEGADVELKELNTFVQVSENVVCFAFAESEGEGIYGNAQQMDFLVGYDTVAGTVSFKPMDCTTA